MRMRHLFSGAMVGVLVCLAVATPAAQSSAQIQAALQLFLQQAHSWTQTQTFQNVVINGTCTGSGCGGGGGIGGSIANTQVAVGSGADTIAGSVDLTWNGSIFTIDGALDADTGHLGNRFNAFDDDGTIVNVDQNDSDGTNYQAFQATFVGSGTNTYGSGLTGQYYNDGVANATGIGAFGYANHGTATTVGPFTSSELDGVGGAVQIWTTGTVDQATGVYGYGMIDHGGGAATINKAYSFYGRLAPVGSTVTTGIHFYAEELANKATNAYAFWADEQGVFRIRADNTFNSVYQAIPALYNPQFAKYTPGATNFERVVQQWESNVAVLTTEKGGTGTLRAMRIGDTGVTVSFGGAADLTNGTSLPVSTGISGLGTGVATFLATPSSANLAAALTDETGSGVAMFGTSPTITTGYTVTGGTVTSSSPLVSATQTWNAAVAFIGGNWNYTCTSCTQSAANNIYTGSKFVNWQLAGTDKAAIMSNGKIVMTPVGGLGGSVGPSYGWIGNFNTGIDFDTTRNAMYFTASSVIGVGVLGSGAGLEVTSTGKYAFSATSDALASVDTGICRNGAGIVEFNNGTCGTLRDYKNRHSLSGGTAPSIASGFGTSPSIAGGDESGRVTVGTGGTAATGVVTFGTAYGTAPACVANNETTVQLVQCTATTTNITLTSTSAWGVGDKLTWRVGGY